MKKFERHVNRVKRQKACLLQETHFVAVYSLILFTLLITDYKRFL